MLMEKIKWLKILFTISFCIIAMTSSSINADNISKRYFTSKNPPANDKNKSFHLSNDALGLKGPLSLSAQYSSEFGYLLNGQWTQKLGLNNALSLMLDLGQNERRINATWGRILTARQRFKLTAEYLEQNKDFDFLSGNKFAWIGQSAYGLTYQYLFPHSFINNINFNTFYSHAFSKRLSQKLFTDSVGRWTNLRRIAGGTDKSASLGVDLLPAKNSLLGLQLNYDNVRYDMRYERADNDSGLGATVSLNQLITKHIKLDLLASRRQTDDTYQAGLSWLLHSNPGTQLELSLNGTRILGRTEGVQNDSRMGLEMNYRWSGDSNSIFNNYQIAATNAGMNDLAAWAAEPAVHMAQVLAVKDESKIRSTTNDEHITAGTNITVKAGEAKIIDVSKCLGLSNNINLPHNYSVSYPSNHDISYQNGKLIIHKDSFNKNDQGKTYPVIIHLTTNSNELINIKTNNNKAELLIKVLKDGHQFPYINPNFKPKDITLPGNYTVDPTIEGMTYIARFNTIPPTPEGLFGDDLPAFNVLSLSVEGLHDGSYDSGLKYKFTKDGKKDDNGTLEIFGKTSNIPHVYHVKIYASNHNGRGPTPQEFNIKITSGPPTVTIIPEPHEHWGRGSNVNQKIAEITVNEGELKSVKFDKDIFKHFGLTLSEKNRTNRTDEIWIKGISTYTVDTTTTISAEDTDGKSAKGVFRLIIDP